MISTTFLRASGLLPLAFSLSALAWGQEAELATRIYERTAKSVLLIILRSADGHSIAQGTGFLIENGKIITNEHVIHGGMPVVDLGGVRVPATVELVDAVNDIAILTTSAEISAAPLVFAEKTPLPGSSVFAIGNPEGLEKSISSGVLAGVRQVGARQLLQITTAISPGSSGGPVFDIGGKVIGIAVGSIEAGQNLNFAVPFFAVVKLMRGQSEEPAVASTLLQKVGSLLDARLQTEWSVEPESPFQKLVAQITSTLSAALDHADKDDVDLLVDLAHRFGKSALVTDSDAAVSIGERALRLSPSPRIKIVLAESLDWKASVHVTNAEQKRALLDRAEKLCREAITGTQQPNAAMYYTLGDILADRESYSDADTTLRRALELNRANPNVEQQSSILRDLLNVADGLKHLPDVRKWFDALVQAGAAGAWDWKRQATRLDAVKLFSDAGSAWQQAATLGTDWTWWCEAMGSFELAGENEDSILYNARKCIAAGSGKPKSEAKLADAHRAISVVLDDRGVYEEALSHARESITLSPEEPWAYHNQAIALRSLGRNQEAINAAKQAIRLSDGKFGSMHFQLGMAYFQTENWQFAKQSFEKAAELMAKDDVAAYNVAICQERLGLSLDAAKSYEEVLRRNPKRTDRQELLNRILLLRR